MMHFLFSALWFWIAALRSHRRRPAAENNFSNNGASDGEFQDKVLKQPLQRDSCFLFRAVLSVPKKMGMERKRMRNTG
jgi:hypothetical protein